MVGGVGVVVFATPLHPMPKILRAAKNTVPPNIRKPPFETSPADIKNPPKWVADAGVQDRGGEQLESHHVQAHRLCREPAERAIRAVP
jgi:hypothetical protein